MFLKQIQNSLNKEQLEAVAETTSPVFVLSGAGTGKTRVITHKIAHLIADKKIKPDHILAMTFTNKAAGEMRERAYQLIQEFTDRPVQLRHLWIGTFHANCARILRYHGSRLGYTSNFSIIDEQDRVKLLKEITGSTEFRHLGKISRVKEDISRAKNSFLGPEDILKQAESEGEPYYLELAEVFKRYQKHLFRTNTMDFDDLITNVVKIFYMDKEIRSYWQKKFDYILVDEFQDTNKSQYMLLKLLMREKGSNLTMVGDDDQSIYSFRGATIENVHALPLDFEGLKVIRVVQNYRSVPGILNIANRVIKNNSNRLGKDLKPAAGEEGELPVVYHSDDDKDESRYIADSIREMLNENPHWTFAVIYRVNAQSRIFESALLENGLAYTMLGAKSFYDRKEIKDLMAYFRLILNPRDDIALKRVVNTPARGVGQVTLEKLEAMAREEEKSILEIIPKAVEEKSRLKIRAKTADNLKEFSILIDELRELAENDPAKVLKLLLEALDFIKFMESYGDEKDRIQNIEELERYYDSYFDEEEGADFTGFMAKMSLLDHSEAYGEEYQEKQIFLTTVHGCKGLEFDAVYVCGMAEEVFPHYMSTSSAEQLEEERRLFYVAVTRAKQMLTLSYPKRMYKHGNYEYFFKSRFLDEIPQELFSLYESEEVGWGDLKDFKGFFS